LKKYVESADTDSQTDDAGISDGMSVTTLDDGTRIISGTVGGSTVDAKDLFKLVNLNEDEWTVFKLTVKPRTVAMKLRHQTVNPDGSVGYVEVPHSHNAWSLHAELRPRTDVQVKIKSLEHFMKRLETNQIPVPKNKILFNSKSEVFTDKHSLVFNIADLHLGKLAVDESWTIEDAVKEHSRAVRYILEQGSVYNIEEIILWWGHDLTQVDNVKGQTTRGTQVESNASWYSQFDAGVELGVRTATMCLEYADTVRIKHVPGNHDWNTSYGVCKALQCYFHGNPNISVDVYRDGIADYEYGKNFIMGTHGNNSSYKNASMFMAIEYPDQWARCPYREMHTGHLHKKDGGVFISEYTENQGTTVRQAPSLSLTDNWHHLKTFVGTLRAAQAHLYSKNAGYKTTFNWNADAYFEWS